jgi:dCMP deaminase
MNTEPNNINISDSKIDDFIKTKFLDNNQRPNWDNLFMGTACLASKRSTCNRLHVGCVIVNNNRVITTGYNGFLKGAPHQSVVRDGHEQFTIHAEQNAICDAAYRGVSLTDTTAYITHYPCLNCFKLLITSGVNEIRYLNDYKNDELVAKMAIENRIKLIQL